MKTHESQEMYLETILKLHESGSRVKSVDIANELGVSRPSVSSAMKQLQKDGCVSVGAGGEILLTEKGRSEAESVYDRHCVFKKMLMEMGVEESKAEENACRIEHVVDDETFALIKRHLENRE